MRRNHDSVLSKTAANSCYNDSHRYRRILLELSLYLILTPFSSPLNFQNYVSLSLPVSALTFTCRPCLKLTLPKPTVTRHEPVLTLSEVEWGVAERKHRRLHKLRRDKCLRSAATHQSERALTIVWTELIVHFPALSKHCSGTCTQKKKKPTEMRDNFSFPTEEEWGS